MTRYFYTYKPRCPVCPVAPSPRTSTFSLFHASVPFLRPQLGARDAHAARVSSVAGVVGLRSPLEPLSEFRGRRRAARTSTCEPPLHLHAHAAACSLRQRSPLRTPSGTRARIASDHVFRVFDHRAEAVTIGLPCPNERARQALRWRQGIAGTASRFCHACARVPNEE